MKSIKGRLLSAFLSVIAILSVTSLAFLGISIWVTQQYRAVSDTMIAEYRLVDNTQTLIDAFNTRVQSVGTDTSASQKRIDASEVNIKQLVLSLDTAVLDTQSRSDYLGFKASVEQLTGQIDESLKRVEQTGIQDYFNDYNKANKQYGFVRDNGTALLFSQLKYASSLQEKIDNTYKTSIFFGLALLAFLVMGSIFFALRFAVKLTKPLTKLTFASQELARGNMQITLQDVALRTTDEVGILAQSFETMAVTLRDKISQLDTQNKEIAGSAEILSAKNHELESMNKLMVDRELKMVELKKRVAELEATK